MSEDVFPRRNLPAAAEPWGRKHDEVVRMLVRKYESLRLDAQGNNRAAAGQMGVVGRQIDTLAEQQQVLSDQQIQLNEQVLELNQRSSTSTAPANLQLIHGGSSGESGPVTRQVSLPEPQGGRRTATIFGSGTIAWTGSNTGSGIADVVTVGLEFRQSGTRRWFSTERVESSSMFTFSGDPTFSVVIPVRVPSGGSTWDIRMWVGRTSSGGQSNAGARLENMNFTIVYGDKY